MTKVASTAPPQASQSADVWYRPRWALPRHHPLSKPLFSEPSSSWCLLGIPISLLVGPWRAKIGKIQIPNLDKGSREQWGGQGRVVRAAKSRGMWRREGGEEE